MTDATKLEPGLQIVALDQLHEAEDNPRQISDAAFEDLRYNLKADPEMLHARPMIADETGELVCGNMRHRALTADGVTEAPTFVKTDWKPGQKREWMIRDNNEFGDWVPEELAAMVALHQQENADMKLLGLSEPKVDNLLKLADQTDGGNGGGGGNDGEAPAEVFAIVIECESGEQQAQLLEEFADRSLEARALLS